MFQPGDHIRSDRGLYHHHGIYVGDGMVIHLSGKMKKIGPSACQKCRENGKRNGEIAKTCLDCFVEGGVGAAEIVVYKFLTPRPADKVIKTATDLLEKGGFGSYNMLFNNCEHFARYCKTGSEFSRQTWNVIGTAVGTAIVGPVAPFIGVFTFIIGKIIT